MRNVKYSESVKYSDFVEKLIIVCNVEFVFARTMVKELY